MKLTLLGTGCPSVDFKRCGSSNLICSKKTKILVDCGSGVTQRLHQSGNSSADIDALLLTHLHTDHVVDLYQLIISSWHSDRNTIWKIYGPKGTKKFIDKIFLAWKSERELRISHEKRKSINALKYKVYEFKRNGSIKILQFKENINLNEDVVNFIANESVIKNLHCLHIFPGSKFNSWHGITHLCVKSF